MSLVAKLTPAQHQATPVAGSLSKTTRPISPYDSGPVANASSARLSPPLQPGKLQIFGFISPSTAPTLAIGPDERMWFAEYNDVVFGTLTPDGVVTTYAPGASGFGGAVAIGADGTAWFGWSDAQHGSVGRLTQGGAYVQFAVHGKPTRMTVGPDAAIWATDQQDGLIMRLGVAGAETDFQLPAGRSPLEITAGPDGAVWFGNLTSIGRLTTDGSYYEIAAPAANIAFAPDHGLWASSGGGLRGGAITEWAVTGQRLGTWQIDGGPSEIVATPDDSVWFLAYSGMLGVERAGRLQLFSIDANADVSNGLVSGAGYLWISMPFGVARYTP